MKVLVLGASGFLGGHLYKKLKGDGKFQVLGTFNNSSNNEELARVDVTNQDEVQGVMKAFNPDVIIWSLMSTYNEEVMVKSGLNNILRTICKNAKLVFISSNAVFSSGKGNYKETDKPQIRKENDNLALYAMGKIYGEEIVKEMNNYIIVRPGAIYGKDIYGRWDKRIEKFISEIENHKKVIRTKNLYNTFVKVEELASGIIELIKMNYKGIIHLGPQNKESYHSYYRRISKQLGLDDNIVKGNIISDEEAERGNILLDNSINTDKARSLLGNVFL
ncbi:MAG: NAD-dependent epimerase/dehydratase family protein [Clostridium sp.]